MYDVQTVECVQCGCVIDVEQAVTNGDIIYCPQCGRANYIHDLDVSGVIVQEADEDEQELYIEGYLSDDLDPVDDDQDEEDQDEQEQIEEDPQEVPETKPEEVSTKAEVKKSGYTIKGINRSKRKKPKAKRHPRAKKKATKTGRRRMGRHVRKVEYGKGGLVHCSESNLRYDEQFSDQDIACN